MTQHSNFSLRAARARFAREIGANFLNTSPLAARHKTAAASDGGRLVPATGRVGSVVTLIAALQIWQRTSVEIRPFEPMHL
jgi:hypothetical protein